MINKDGNIVPTEIIEPSAELGVGGKDSPRGEEKIRGDQLYYSPRPALTTAVTTAFTQSGIGPYLDGAGIARLNNMYTRIGEIEAVLIKLGLLKA